MLHSTHSTPSGTLLGLFVGFVILVVFLVGLGRSFQVPLDKLHHVGVVVFGACGVCSCVRSLSHSKLCACLRCRRDFRNLDTAGYLLLIPHSPMVVCSPACSTICPRDSSNE